MPKGQFQNFEERRNRKRIEMGYPHHRLGRMVFDEQCQCGAMRSEHRDTRISVGYGSCSKTKCKQFTWIGYIYDDTTQG